MNNEVCPIFLIVKLNLAIKVQFSLAVQDQFRFGCKASI